MGGRLDGGTGANLHSLCAKTRASDVVLWAAGATVRFYPGERVLSNPHRLCRVTLNRCLLHQKRQLAHWSLGPIELPCRVRMQSLGVGSAEPPVTSE